MVVGTWDFGLDDYILIVAFLLSVALVIQTTWAIYDEGQDRHISEVPRTQAALIAKVLDACIKAIPMLIFILVASDK